MALMFPSDPTPGELYPPGTGTPGVVQYQWDGTKWEAITADAVTSIIAGTGLSGGTITSSGTISILETGVCSGSYTYGSFTVNAEGQLIAASSGIPPVIDVTAAAPLVSTGGLTPEVCLSDTAVLPGSYIYGSFTVDQKGRLTAASNSPAPLSCSIITAKGDLIAGTGAATATALPIGADGQVLRVNSVCSRGLEWYTVPAAATYSIQNIDDISGGFDGLQKSFTLTIGGSTYSPVPPSNISVYVGGVPQIPGAGNAYTISGSTITFSEAPSADSSFYAFTVT